MNIKEVLIKATGELMPILGSTASLDAKILFKHVTGYDDLYLVLHPDEEVTTVHYDAFRHLLDRRLAYEPIAYIIGHKEFWGLSFKVTPATLIPRPDSELFIESALKHFPKNTPLRILDLGTGSGCLILSLLHEFQNASGMGIDQSAEALQVAQENAENLGLKNRVSFQKSHWCESVSGQFDLIVANPPYIPEATPLMPDVAKYEPNAALYGGTDGFDAYRTLIPQLKRHSHEKTLIFFEIGQGQAEEITVLLKMNNMKVLDIKNDLQSIERLIICSFLTFS